MRFVYEGIAERIERVQAAASINDVVVKAVHLSRDEANKLHEEIENKYGSGSMVAISGVRDGGQYMGIRLIIGEDDAEANS